MRNPWGDTQYTGKYGDKDTNFWEKIPSGQRKSVFGENEENNRVFVIELN
jgi:hypothetical protein